MQQRPTPPSLLQLMEGVKGKKEQKFFVTPGAAMAAAIWNSELNYSYEIKYFLLDGDDEDDDDPLEELGLGLAKEEVNSPTLADGASPAATSWAARISVARRYLEEGSGRQKNIQVCRKNALLTLILTLIGFFGGHSYSTTRTFRYFRKIALMHKAKCLRTVSEIYD